MLSKRSLLSVLGLFMVLALLLGACSPAAPEPTEAPPTDAPAEDEPAEDEPAEEPMVDFNYPPGGFLERALAGEFEGTEVIVDGPFADADEVKFNKSMDAFEEATGITVNYIGNKEFEGSISIRRLLIPRAGCRRIGLLGSIIRAGSIWRRWRDRRLVCGTASTGRAWSGIRKRSGTPLAMRSPRPGMR